MLRKGKIGGSIFDIFNHALLLIIALVTFFPFVYVILVSFTPPEDLVHYSFFFIPRHLTLESYRYIFSNDVVTKSLLVSVCITVAGTLLNIVMTSLMAYPIAHKNLMGKKLIMIMVTFTLLFEGGMIPSYIVVLKLGLMNTYAGVLLPGAINAFSLILFINFFKQLPEELEESARIDGCHELIILIRIILPLSMPLIATFIVWFGVAQWNSWFNYVLYMNDSTKWPVQVVLRQIMSSVGANIGDSAAMHDQFYRPPAEVIKMCIITIATIPILCVYPFVQKHFVKGMMLGSVKG